MSNNVHLVLKAKGGAAMDRFAITTLRARGHKVKIGCHNSRVELLLNNYPREFVVISNAIYSIESTTVDVNGSIMYRDGDGSIKEFCKWDSASTLIKKIFKKNE